MPKAPATAPSSAAPLPAARTARPAAAGATPPALPLPATYEAALQELEQLVARIDSGQLPLDQLLAGYQRGAELLHYCRERLAAVEDQIKVLDDGILTTWTPT